MQPGKTTMYSVIRDPMFLRLMGFALLACSLVLVETHHSVAYQENGDEKKAASPAEKQNQPPAAKADAQPAEKKNAVPAPMAAPKDANGQAAAPETIERESFLVVVARANGFFFGPALLLCSFLMVALVTINAMQIRRDVLIPPEFVEDFEKRLAGKDYQGAYELARTDESFVARVLAAGLGRLSRGYSEAIEGMQEVGEDENMTLEHRVSYLSLLGTVGPMLGLMGTVWGMILAFEQIATSTTQPKPKDLANDIYTALFTTLEGLMIAIPAMIAYGMLRNRLARFVLEIGIISEGLMSRFSTAGKQSPSAPAQQPAAKT